MSKTAARLAIGFAVAGLIASTLASYTHYRVLSDPSYSSFCDVSVVVSCTQVYSSRFGSVGGISVAVFGMIWFGLATLLAIAGVAGPPAVRENVPSYLFAGSTISLAIVLYLGYASFVVLKLVCVLCLMTYASVLGLFLTTGAASSPPILSLPRRAAADLKRVGSSPLAIALSVLLVVGAASAFAFFPRAGGSDAAAAPASEPEPDERVRFDQWYKAQPRVSLDVPTEGAAVLVVKFNDFQCPPCGQTYLNYRDVFAKYATSQPGAVRLVLKDFPLETECNAGVTGDLHPSACEAAVAVRLAGEHGKAQALEEWLFENQPDLTPELVRQAAREVGHVTNFEERYAATLEEVKADIAYGRRLGVGATPTFFVNGIMIRGGIPTHLFDQAIAYELQRAASK